MLIDMLDTTCSQLQQRNQAQHLGDAQLPAIGAVTAAGMIPGGSRTL